MHGDVTERHVHAVVKAEREGVDALNREERTLYDEAFMLMRNVAASISVEQRRIMKDGLEAYTRLPPADQMRYQAWTARELLAFLPLIEGDTRAD